MFIVQLIIMSDQLVGSVCDYTTHMSVRMHVAVVFYDKPK